MKHHLAHLLMLLYRVINHHHRRHQKAIVGEIFFFIRYITASVRQADRHYLLFLINKVKSYVKTVRYIHITF